MPPEMDKIMQPAKVLHAVEDLKIGGMERVIASIVTGIDPAKYTAHVLCLTKGGAVADELIGRRIPVTILGLDNYHHPGQMLTLCRWLRNRGYHILHTHGYFAGVFARIAGLLAGIPHIVNHVHSAYVDYQNKHLRMEKILSFRTDRIICVSRAVQEWVVESEKIDRKKTVVIYNGTDLKFSGRSDGLIASELRRTLEIPDRDTVFTVVASLTPNKGHHILFESFKILLDTDPHATLLIVGEGPLRTELEARVLQLTLDRKIIFAGLQNDVSAFLKISDVCLLPSQTREGLGLALIEAMAAGIPVIGTRIGGIPEAVADGENGFLAAPGDAKTLADAMLRIATDKDLKIRMGERSRQIYEAKFSLSGMIQNLETLYSHLPAPLSHDATS